MEPIEELFERYPCLGGSRKEIEQAVAVIIKCYNSGGKVLTCGNGGSCADSDHIVGELMKGFRKARPLQAGVREELAKAGGKLGDEIAAGLQTPLAAINLCAHDSLNTAFGNDADPILSYAQQALGYARKNDVFIGISTSGNAKNVVAAGIAAKAAGASAVGLCGEKPCDMDGFFDCVIHVPETETYRVQELHLPIYHAICIAVEDYFFKD